MEYIFYLLLVPVSFVLSLHLFFAVIPDWIAKNELSKYWKEKTNSVSDGGLMFDCMLKSESYEVFVRFDKPKAPFQKGDKGRIMIRRIDGKHFFMDYSDVPIHIRMYWDTLISNQSV